MKMQSKPSANTTFVSLRFEIKTDQLISRLGKKIPKNWTWIQEITLKCVISSTKPLNH